MEAFSLLKYWRAGGGVVSDGATTATEYSTTKTIVTAAAVSPYSSDGEDGPYFDLEFAIPDHESDADDQTSAESQENDVVKRRITEDEDETESEEMSVVEDEDEAELKFSLSSNESTDQNAALSPSDDLFFKGDLVSIEPSSILLNAAAEDNSKFPVFLVKSATKFRVLLLKLKKSKSVNGGENPETLEKSGKVDEASTHVSPKILERENRGKFFVKFKEEEEVEAPLVKLFTKDNSSKQTAQDSDTNSAAADERKLSKEMMNKYLKMVKPFYIRVSKRYVEKLKFSGNSAGASKGCATSPPPSNGKSSHHKQGSNLQAGLKVVRKHLGKSRSASASAAAAAAPPVVSDRRDDSLLQVQDGIQGAILHCKKSFNASRDVEASSILSRSVSDPSYEKSIMMPKFSRASSSTSKGIN